MKTLIKLSVIFALFLTSGCTFDTDIDADLDFNDPFASEDDRRCDSIRVLAEAESDEATRDELAAAYDRCLHSDDGTEPDREGDDSDGHNDEDQRPDGDDETDDGSDPNDTDDCQTVERETDEGEVYEERQCQPDGDQNDDGTPSDQIDCQEVRDVVANHADDPDTDWARVCAEYGLTDQECVEIMNQCLNGHDETDPDRPGDEDGNGDSDDSSSNLDCQRVVEELEQAGYDVPLDDATAQALYENCVDGMADQDLDPDLCEQVVLCAT